MQALKYDRLDWRPRIIARLVRLSVRADGLAPEELRERGALNVQVGHIATGLPVSRALPPVRVVFR